jgi:hypothetical protein
MAVTPTPVFHQAINDAIQSIVNADGQTKKTIFTPGANGSRLYGLQVSSTDTSARDITIGVTVSATNYDLWTIQIPITAGTIDSTPTVSVFNNSNFSNLPVDAFGNKYLDLPSGYTLYAYAPVTVTSGKQINILATGADL